ncbi:MAG TPA: GNAT family N-acetyltransferase [Pirellulales bacterium]|jgi:CelD/BcsL family acetyltransferase involved in cellulose biosynthesis|nr:GNAT family N-acetyltransferase [Pirellulales bacterium]
MPTTSSTDPLHIEVYDEVARAATRDEWDRLAGGVPFRSWDWADCWSRHYRTAHVRPMVLAVRDVRGQLAGIAPWCISRSTLRGKVISFLGSGPVCSDYLSLLATDDDAPRVATAVAEWLSSAEAEPWDRLHLDGVARDDRAVMALADALHQRKHIVETHATMSAWRIELPDTWEQYLEQLSRHRRSRVRKIVRRWFDSGRCVPRLAETQSDIERGAQVLRDLHQRRRRSLGQSGCFTSPAFAAFHNDAMQTLFDARRLRLHWVEFDGCPIAGEYGVIGERVVYAYQSGFDPDYARLKAGWLNTIASLRLAIEQGFRGYDWMRGDEPYKASWRGHARGLVEVRVIGSAVGARVRHRVLSAGSSARQWLSGPPVMPTIETINSIVSENFV